MIGALSYSVTFPINGLSLENDISFQPGVTAITGRNGSGKTFAGSEMIRYMLFGKKALRRPASDYKTLAGSMSVRIGESLFQIDRGKKETVTDPTGKIVAVGAEAVNQFLAAELGFGLDVFDVVCAARQKDSERLTQLRPAERKKMIDDIVGLSQNEKVEKLCRTESNQLRRDADTLRGTLVEAVEPEQPLGYRPSAEIKVKLDAQKTLSQRRAELEKTVAAAGVAPTAPDTPEPDDALIAELEQHERKRLDIEAKVRALTAIPDATVTAEELDRLEAWEDYEDERIRRGPTPTLPREDVEALLEQWNTYNALKDQERHEAECPKCDHKFLTGVAVPDEPSIPLAVLRTELKAHDNWQDPLPEPEGEPEFIGRQKIKELRRALERQDEKAELQTLVVPENRSDELKEAQLSQLRWQSYHHNLEEWKAKAAAAKEAEKELATLPLPVDLTAEYTDARIYESQYDAYLKAKVREEELIAQINEKTTKAEAYTKGAEALRRTRTTFKSYLAPSLGKIASAIIAQMTNGAFSSVVVDEEMNIAVDGLDVAALSGAQATIANLALRLALGRVLTSKVFPVFIGDEIDADADAEWAVAVPQALMNMKDQIQQIILISHKDMEFADHIIRLPN